MSVVPAVRRKPLVIPMAHDELGSPCLYAVPRNHAYGYGNPHVYATVTLATGASMPAHRWTWMVEHQREIPEGMVVHHKCFRKRCVNPEHLELCTMARNTQYSNWAERKAA